MFCLHPRTVLVLRYCLSYLFTSHEFAADTVGVAYVNGTCQKYQKVKDLVSNSAASVQNDHHAPLLLVQKTGQTMKISMNSGFIAIEDWTNPHAIKV